MKNVIPSILIYKPTGEPVSLRAAVTKERWASLQRDAERILGNFPGPKREQFLKPPPKGDPIREYAEHTRDTPWPVVEIWTKSGGTAFVPLDQIGPIPAREEEIESLKRIYELLEAGELAQAIGAARNLFTNNH